MDYDWRSMNVGVTYAYGILDVNRFKEYNANSYERPNYQNIGFL